MAPSEQQLTDLAAQALAQLDGEGQATVWWERRLAVGEHGISDLVQQTAELVLLRDGRVGAASTTDLSPAGLARAAAAAAAHAELDREPVDARRLPDPQPGEAHDGWDPAVLALDPAALAGDLAGAAGDDLAIELRAGAARVAIASTRGVAVVRAAHVRLRRGARARPPDRGGRSGPAGSTWRRSSPPPRTASTRARRSRSSRARPPSCSARSPSPRCSRRSSRSWPGRRRSSPPAAAPAIAAPCVSLSDAPRVPGTLPRSYDAEGVPRSTAPLIRDGVAHGVVADTASGGTTGHATRPGHAEPWPEHLVLDGGAAADVAELAAPIALGLDIPAFLLTDRGWLLDGARLIEAGERTWAATGVAEVDPLAVLAATEALTGARRLVPTDDDSALTIGATLAPALRARGGIAIVG